MRFTHKQRLRKQADFFRVRQKGSRAFGPCFLMQLWVNDEEGDPFRRLGVIASKKVGKAFKRNRGKRIFRELFRHHQESLPKNCDMVLVIRPNFDQYGYTEVEAFFVQALKQAVCKQCKL